MRRLPVLLFPAICAGLITRSGRPAHFIQSAQRSRPCVGSLDDSDDKLGDELAAEFQKALSRVSREELSESDARVLDAFVDDKRQAFDAFENELSRELDSVQDAIDSRLEGELRSLSDSVMDKIDAAVESLRREDTLAPESVSVGRPAGAAQGLAASLPADALIVVAGVGSAVGQNLVNALAGGDWRIRALVPEGTKCVLPEGVESMPMLPFAPTALKKSLAGADAIVIISAAAGGSGGVDAEALPRLMKAVEGGVRQLVILSTHGVDRTDKLPFNLQNMMGALDKQRACEQEVILRAKRGIPSYSVVRIGKLKGSGSHACQIAPGDALSGDMTAEATADVLLETLQRPEAVNASFSAGRLEGPVSTSAWDDEFLKLVGPELYRRPLDVVKAEAVVSWLKDWARGFLRPGSGLTTPVAVQNTVDGVLLRFQQTGAEYLDFDEVETDDAKWAKAKPGATDRKSNKSDGALLIIAEASPSPRVRVTRAEMEDGVVIKEMSEAAVIAKLEKDLKDLESTARRR